MVNLGYLYKSSLDIERETLESLESVDVIIKGRRALPVGTRKEYNGRLYVKEVDGWKFYNDSKISDNAYQYVLKNEKSLVDTYIKENPNMVDPDKIREFLRPVGYTGAHVAPYKKAGDYLVDRIFDEILTRNIGKKLVILTGNPGAGKSVSKGKFVGKDAILYDGALSKFSSLNGIILKGKKHNMDITVIQVKNDPVTSNKNAIGRGVKSKRFVPLSYFIRAYTDAKGKYENVLKEHNDVKLIGVDNDGNKPELKQVTHDEAKKWNYEVTSDDINKILNHVENEKREGRLNKSQITAIFKGLSNVKRDDRLWTSENNAIYERIIR